MASTFAVLAVGSSPFAASPASPPALSTGDVPVSVATPVSGVEVPVSAAAGESELPRQPSGKREQTETRKSDEAGIRRIMVASAKTRRVSVLEGNEEDAPPDRGRHDGVSKS